MNDMELFMTQRVRTGCISYQVFMEENMGLERSASMGWFHGTSSLGTI